MTLTQVEATPQAVMAMHESINLPLVSIPNIGTAPTQAYVLGLRNDNGSYSVMVVLRQSENDANLVYVSDPRNLGPEQYRFEEQEGLRFVESMGFLMDDHSFRALSPDRQTELMERTPIFAGSVKAARPTLDLVEVEEEPASSPEILGPDPMFGGLENVPMLKGEPASPPTFEGRRASMFPGAMSNQRSPAGSMRPSAPAPPIPASMRPGAAVPSARPHQTSEMSRPGTQEMVRPVPPAPAAPKLSDEALSRLGRFLSTFLLACVLGVGLARCVHSQPPDENLSADQQNKLDIGEHYLANAQWAEAVGALQPLVKDMPKNPAVHHGLGLAFMYLERYELAETSLKTATEVDPSFTMAKNSLATLYMMQGRCAEAAVLLNDVITDFMYPTPEFAQDNLAKAEHCLGKSAEAITRLRRLVLAKPQFCRGYLTLADISSAAKVPEVTIQACDEFQNRCEMHEKIGKLVSPENRSLCYLRKGMAHAAEGDYDAARQSLARCDSLGVYGQECRKSLQLLDGQ